MFADREDAGRRLAAKLTRFKGPDTCVLALPRGGVPVAFYVAERLGAPLDLVLVRKIGAPSQPELAVGAVVDGHDPEVVVNEDVVAMFHLPKDYLKEETARQLKEIERRREVYLAGRPRIDLAGRTVLIVDDGIATGATIKAALRATRRAKPKRLVLAVPVAPVDTIEALRGEADEVVCLEAHELFGAIGAYYADFTQVGDDEVRDLMARADAWRSSEPAPPHSAS
ncbi:MAG TPA: phosphoribosyltransferase [Candidatus Dormibacteraeota bacterium]|nr:phosphoribosyltransferase [Candidatus Dormibacteraeota bacterium]